ncbi:MAG: aminodeoxychorismate/anthranilate synthase component II [Flavobacteriaceae bacterium]|nr:aminodeoxychorismate/anthranilate synthase component II [Flavobacteriaceae bacterium]
MNILIVDNYDSFTYNLVHLINEIIGKEVTICTNDELENIQILDFDKVILSPGPGVPSEAGKLIDFIQKYAHEIPMLGVCLGQQAIAEAFGGKLVQLSTVKHGVISTLNQIQDDVLFRELISPVVVGRYHSWVVDETHFPEQLIITSVDEEGRIMSLKHKYLDLRAVQFHPESILTPQGKKMLSNWIFS